MMNISDRIRKSAPLKRLRRRFRPKPLTRRRKMVLIAAVAVPVLAIFAFGNRGIYKRIQLESRYSEAYRELYRQRAVGDSLRSEIKRMNQDTTAIERIARERFGMYRPGETVYRVVKE